MPLVALPSLWPPSCWPTSAGPATTRLRRFVSRGICGLLTIGLVFVLPGALDGATPPATRWGAIGVVMAGCWVIWRGTRVGFALAELLVLLAITIGTFLTPDTTGSTLHFAGFLTLATYLVACVSAVKMPWVLLLGILGLVGGVGGQMWQDGRLAMAPVDMAVIPLMLAMSGAGFMHLLIERATRIDASATEALALEIANERTRAREAAEATVQRVLHDEVISALRAVHDLGDTRPDDVRRAAERAVAAIEALDPSSVGVPK